ncbi:ATP-dependent metallopeptidase FtsH/Yme1/Tma family protein [Bacillota bacterium Meth-B3]|nr:AAA family ATPase [Christensenellaceae bacterium]
MRRIDAVLSVAAACCVAAALALTAAGGLAPDAAGICARALLGVALVCAALFFMGGGRARAVEKLPGRFDGAPDEAETPDIRFSDVAANDEARHSLLELTDYLKNPEKYERMGARMPRGVLLYGPPGTGKTLLARALAGEAGVPFFALTGSDFVQMYVGVGASRVRALFDRARKAGKCVIFIDEIDAMGKVRDDHASDEREQTLNALLSEMSGFRPCAGTLVLAATNRLDTLDPALTRPGRFDRQIEVGLPGREERLSILKLHAQNKPIEGDIDLTALAAQTVSFSGASLESLINEAAIRAVGRGAEAIGQQDIDAAYLVAVAGADKKPVASRAELSVIALHEAGHALATRLLLPNDRVTRVSILPTARGAAGYSLSIPQEVQLTDRDRLSRQLCVLLAGRAAELLVGGEDALTSGAMNDLQRASDLAAVMVMDLGMAAEPCVSLRQLQKSIGGQAGEGMQLARELLGAQYKRVTELLAENLDPLMRITEALIEREAIDGAALDALI